MEVKEYVLGFLFNRAGDQVVLIEKQTPEWQRGQLNGVGGKIEVGETPRQAMEREFAEEAGVLFQDWECIILMSGVNWRVTCFRAFDESAFMQVSSTGHERIVRCQVCDIPRYSRLDNLEMLVAIAKDRSGLIGQAVLLYGN